MPRLAPTWKRSERKCMPTRTTQKTKGIEMDPFLNVLSESEVAKTLQLMTRPPDTKLAPEVAHELCQRAGSKAYLAGSIGIHKRQNCSNMYSLQRKIFQQRL